jgi:hypothetical protein
MSGSIAAIAAYDGTGTQGYGTTDKNLPGVKSVFWNENDTDKYYVNGCSFSEVSSNNSEIPSSQASNPGTIVFTFDNDTDAINDLVLTIGAENIQSATLPSSPLPPWFMAGFIERIEICIGNQVISTIFTAQIKQLLISDKYLNLSVQGRGNVSQISSDSNGSVYTNIRLPIFNLINSKTNCSYLMACANNQVLQVKVYPQFLTQSDYNTNFLSSYPGATTDNVTIATENSNLITINDHGFGNGETLIYSSGGGTPIDGLEDGKDYYVSERNENSFRLTDPADVTTIVRFAGQGNDLQTFTRASSPVIVLTNQVNTSADSITINDHGFVTGTVVIYSAGPGPAQYFGLTSGETYYVIKLNENSFKLAANLVDAQLETAIILTGQGNDSQTFTRVYQAIPVTKNNVIIYSSDPDGTITINDHGFVTGDVCIVKKRSDTAIGGFTSDETYYVIKVNENSFKLAADLVDAQSETAISLDETFIGAGFLLNNPDQNVSLWNINIGADNKFTFNLYANKYSMTNSERDFLRSQVIPKRTNVTQSATISNPQTVSGYPHLSTSTPITIICDNFNINAEKLYITSIGEYGKIPLFNVELFLNSTSYCGTIQSSVSEISMGPTYSQYISTVAGTGAESCKIAEIYFAKNSKEYNTDQNYVPLSKYDSIRIVLTPLTSSNMTIFSRFLDYLTVVVEGKCTALYQNGAVVFNNY